MSEKPQGNTPVPASDPLATVDREFRAMLARMTGGISPQDYGAAFADWWLHFATSPSKQLEVQQKYSWLKAPRWNELPVEVGPLARVLALYATGHEQTRELTDGYLANAAIIRSTLEEVGLFCVGGRNAPYVWVQTGRDSWEFFNVLLEKAGVVSTPGSGFGRCGAGYIRFSAFNSRENVVKAMGKVRNVLG